MEAGFLWYIKYGMGAIFYCDRLKPFFILNFY